MKLKVGDKVKFLNDTGGGEVTKLLSGDMVNVKTEEGFEVPVLADELLKTGNEESMQEEVFTESEEKEEPEAYDVFETAEPDTSALDSATDPDNEIHLAFVPEDQENPQNSNLALYLINDSDFHIYYLILLKRETSYTYFTSGRLEDNTKIYLKNIEREYLSEIKEFKIQIIFHQKGFYNPVPPLDTDLKLKPQKFFKSSTFTESDFFDELAHLVEIRKESMMSQQLSKLTDEDIQKAIKEKETGRKRSNQYARRNTNSEIEEVDLHIEELVDRPKELSNKEMLDIQMDKFHTKLNEAMNSKHLKKIVFIHGVGNGRLRYELRKSLDRNYKKLDYQDASFKEYGYGATLVLLKK